MENELKNEIKKMNKKAEWKIEPGLAWFFLIIILVIITMWVGTWECRNDIDCGNDQICTSKHICYKQAQTVETTIIKNENKYTTASLILGICIIISAIILRKEDLKIITKIKQLKIFKK